MKNSIMIGTMALAASICGLTDASMAQSDPPRLKTMSQDDPRCLSHVPERGCVVVDFPNAIVVVYEGDAIEAARDPDAVDLVYMGKEALDLAKDIKFFAVDVPKLGAGAAMKLKILGSIKALPVTLAWEVFDRTTTRNEIMLVRDADLDDIGSEEVAQLTGSGETLEGLRQDTFWPMMLHYSPKGFGGDGDEGGDVFSSGLNPPRANPTLDQASRQQSWVAPNLDFPEEWAAGSLARFRTARDTLYVIVPKSPLVALGGMASDIGISATATLRGKGYAETDYRPDEADDPFEMGAPEDSVAYLSRAERSHSISEIFGFDLPSDFEAYQPEKQNFVALSSNGMNNRELRTASEAIPPAFTVQVTTSNNPDPTIRAMDVLKAADCPLDQFDVPDPLDLDLTAWRVGPKADSKICATASALVFATRPAADSGLYVTAAITGSHRVRHAEIEMVARGMMDSLVALPGK